MDIQKIKWFLWNLAKEYIPNRSFLKKIKKMYKYSIPYHKNAASSPDSLLCHSEWFLKWTTIKPEIIREIGANYGQDAAGLAEAWNIQNNNVYCFEAVPEICTEIPKFYDFNVFNLAVYNHNNGVKINSVDTKKKGNSGISSILSAKANNDLTKKEILVPSIRMDDFMEKHNIQKFDFIKLDVEGCSYEVLEGFGTRLKDVKAIHLEAEDDVVWEGQKLFSDIQKLLTANNFEMMYFKKFWKQSDSIWIQKEYIV